MELPVLGGASGLGFLTKSVPGHQVSRLAGLGLAAMLIVAWHRTYGRFRISFVFVRRCSCDGMDN